MSDCSPAEQPAEESRAELEQLLREVLDGNTTPALERRIAELVESRPELLPVYVQWMHMHLEISYLIGDPRQPVEQSIAGPAGWESARGEREAHTSDLAAVESQGSSPSLLKVQYWREHRVRFGALALALTLLFWIGMGWIIFSRFGGGGAVDDSPMITSIAQITNLRSATWAAGAVTHELDAPLAAGDTLELAGGYVEITFAHGAVVLLDAPASFTVETRGAGTLEYGRLVARIEKQEEEAIVPFAVSTPLAQLIDRGTEFGVEAVEDGATQVEVFEGRVEATPRGAAGGPQSRPLLLVQGQTVRIEPGDTEFDEDQAGQFVRELPVGDIVPARLSAANWRRMKTRSLSAGVDEIGIYSSHETREESTLISFDVSAYYGATAAGPGTMTFIVEEGPGVSDDGSFRLDLHQLSPHNAAVDLDTASSTYLDGAAVLWKNNAGEVLENLGYTNSVLDISSGLVAARRGPFGGDTATTAPPPGTRLVFTIPQSTLQSWFDQEAPPIVVLSADRGVNGMTEISDLIFKRAATHEPPFLEFELSEPASETTTENDVGQD